MMIAAPADPVKSQYQTVATQIVSAPGYLPLIYITSFPV